MILDLPISGNWDCATPNHFTYWFSEKKPGRQNIVWNVESTKVRG